MFEKQSNAENMCLIYPNKYTIPVKTGRLKDVFKTSITFKKRLKDVFKTSVTFKKHQRRL